MKRVLLVVSLGAIAAAVVVAFGGPAASDRGGGSFIRDAARELLATQRADGGWTQLDERQLTDAYATGEALVALRESGAVEATDPAYRKGVEYLLRTQIADGSWFVESRSEPIQAAFASGFPYGPHQWVSAAATGWAVTALALAK